MRPPKATERIVPARYACVKTRARERLTADALRIGVARVRGRPRPVFRRLRLALPMYKPRSTGACAIAVSVVGLCCVGGAVLGGASAAAARRGCGPVDVLYAGSLVDLMQKRSARSSTPRPATSFDGLLRRSTALAAEIKGKTQVADVFVSAGTQADASLEGPANGSWVPVCQLREYRAAPAYNPASNFARDLETMPWYKVVTLPGFLLMHRPRDRPERRPDRRCPKRGCEGVRDPALLCWRSRRRTSFQSRRWSAVSKRASSTPASSTRSRRTPRASRRSVSAR